MQADVVPTVEAAPAALAELGVAIRARRKQLRVSATAAAESAGLSRVTLHRIERGEPSVAMVLYQRALGALGLRLELAGDASAAPQRDAAPPGTLRLSDLPELRRVAWQLDPAARLTPEQALDLYERNWRHVDPQAMTAKERALLERLVRKVGGGRLLVRA